MNGSGRHWIDNYRYWWLLAIFVLMQLVAAGGKE
jgi:uncharacterized membrane protein YdjX (TVP38/TMEM64 family)